MKNFEPIKMNKKEIESKLLFIIYNKYYTNISFEDFIFIYNNDDCEFIWNFLLSKNLEKLYNFLITVKIAINYFDFTYKKSEIEKKVYNNSNEIENYEKMIKILEKILKTNFNEMIKTDLDIINNNNIWVGVNLSNFYSIFFKEIDYENLTKKKKDQELYKKIININIIISTLDRLDGVVFYTKLKNKIYPEELLNNIRFTKGYLICFKPELVKSLKKYKYERKLIDKNPTEIKIKIKNINFYDSILNENFSSPIWMNNENLTISDYKLRNIFNKKLLYKKSNIGMCIRNLNFLNSIKLYYDKNILNEIINIIKKNTNIHQSLTIKNNLENIIYKVNNNESVDFLENYNDLKTLVMSASIIDLILKQLKYYDYFYLSHRLDDRTRIYCYAWPINYQLNHVIRNILVISCEYDIESVWWKFKNHEKIKKILKNFDIFEYKKDNEILYIINELFVKKKIISKSEIEDDLKKEYFYQLILKLGPNSEKCIKKKFLFIYYKIEDFINSNLELDWEKWLLIFKIKKKKLPYLINYQKSIKEIFDNIFKNTFWADASSNAIQLIILRLGKFNKFLLKLVNIVDNDTEYSNIYEYVTENIKKLDHSNFLNKIDNCITSEELNFLQDIDNSKYLMMPSSYGMGSHSYRESLDKMIKNDERNEIWSKLNNNNKKNISDYFWIETEKILKNIDFDMNEYKEICKEFWKNKDYESFIWKNDLGITVGPVNLEHSKRDFILEKINILNIKKKEKSEKNEISIINDKIKKLKIKLAQDEKSFWKRTMVNSKNNKIFSRIYHKKIYNIDKHKTRTSIIANSIHSYDACNMHLSVSICKDLGIKVLVIHDSIGCQPLYLTLVKYIFKIVNIYFLLKMKKNKIFPLKNKINNKNKENLKIEEVVSEILKSKNFFK